MRMKNEFSPERIEYAHNEQLISAPHRSPSRMAEVATIKERQQELFSKIVKNARMLDAVYDAHGGFPELPPETAFEPEEYIALLHNEILRLLPSFGALAEGAPDEEWLREIEDELNALLAKRDPTPDEIDWFQSLYRELAENHFALEKEEMKRNFIESEARMLDAVYDAHGGFPELPENSSTDSSSFVNAMKSEITELSRLMKESAIASESDRWMEIVSGELDALTKKSDLSPLDIERFRAIYGEMTERRNALWERLDHETDPARLLEERVSMETLENERAVIASDQELSNDDRVEQLRDVDALHAEMIARDPRRYDAYVASLNNEAYGDAIKDAEGELARIVSEVHYACIKEGSTVRSIAPVEPGTVYLDGEIPEGVHAPKLSMEYNGRTVFGHSIRYSLRIYETEEGTSGDLSREVSIDVDPLSGEVRTVVSPRVVTEDGLGEGAQGLPLEVLRLHAIKLLSGILKIGRFVTVPTTGRTASGRVGNTENSERETRLYESRRSQVPFRRITFDRRNTDDVAEKMQEFLSRWSPEARAVLEEEGEGSIKLILLAKRNYVDGKTFTPYPEMVDEHELPRLREIVVQMLESDQKILNVKVCCYGGWIDRVHRSLERGRSPRAHFRRSRGRYDLILPRDSDERSRAIQEKVNGGKSLSDDEKALLQELVLMDAVELEAKITGGIYLKDGRWSETRDVPFVGHYALAERKGHVEDEEVETVE